RSKGNQAFKAGDYPTAIGHYTSAILANNSDPTFYLNRAFAYLKLGKNEDTERDCTKALTLSPNNVKALFRRAQARRALGNLGGAREDLHRALELEPSNTSVKNELDAIDKAMEAEQVKQRKSTVSIQSSLNPKRRRVPIEIIESERDQKTQQQASSSKAANDESFIQPISSRNLKPDNESTTGSPSRPASQAFVEAKNTRESAKGGRVSGGIFRPSGNHTVLTRSTTEQRTTTRPTPTPSKSAASQPLTTLFEFTKTWDSLNTDDARWKLICTIPPASFPMLFQASLEPDLLKSILHTFQGVLNRDPTARGSVQQYLSALMRVQRFGTVMLFMDKQERQLLEYLRGEVESS
ncbi:hypothetical protein J3A83DRAFT_4084838, partial [Scleroderma citrinum]